MYTWQEKVAIKLDKIAERLTSPHNLVRKLGLSCLNHDVALTRADSQTHRGISKDILLQIHLAWQSEARSWLPVYELEAIDKGASDKFEVRDCNELYAHLTT